MGVIYVLTNPSFPDYVKIGYADNLEKRLKQLNETECLPFAFRASCIYEVNEKLKDMDVHNLIDCLNPQLRSIDKFDGKVRIREFYSISADDAYQLFYSIASVSGTLDRLKKVDETGREIEDEEISRAISEKEYAFSLEETYEKERSIWLFEHPETEELYKAFCGKFTDCKIIHKKQYVAFKYENTFCTVVLQNYGLKVFLCIPPSRINDKFRIGKDVSKVSHWGIGDYEVIIRNAEDVKKAVFLAEQSIMYNAQINEILVYSD